MAENKFSVYAFFVAADDNAMPFSDLLAKVQQDSKPLRNHKVNGVYYRVEEIDQRNGLWFIDLIKLREQQGPGKASLTVPISGFVFVGDEVFAEETAALYDPASRFIVMQYNHYGMRAGSMASYFSTYATAWRVRHNLPLPGAYTFRAKFDDDVERRFQERKGIRKLIYKIAPRQFSETDRRAGRSVSEALDISAMARAETMEVTLSADRGNFLSRSVDEVVAWFRGKAEVEPDAIEALKVGILRGEDAKMEILDLLAPRLKQDFSDLPVGDDRRLDREERYARLERAFNGWRNLLK